MAPVRSSRWYFSRKCLLDEILMPTRCPAAIDTRICTDRGLDAAMAEKLFDGFEFSRVAIEYNLGAQVPELVRGEHNTCTPPQTSHDQARDGRRILRRAVGIHKQPFRR
jgi:hypothetical protein